MNLVITKKGENATNVAPVIGLALVALVAVPARGQQTALVGPATMEVQGSQLTIKIAKSAPALRYETSRRLRPLRLLCEFPEAKLQGGPSILKVDRAGVKRVVLEQPKPHLATATLEFSAWPKHYSIDDTPGALLIRIQSDQPLKPVEEPQPVASPVASPVAVKTPSAPTTPKVEPKPEPVAKPQPEPTPTAKPKSSPPPAVSQTEVVKSQPEGGDDAEIKIVKVEPPKPVKEGAPEEKETPAPERPVTDATTQQPLQKNNLDQKVDLHLQNADLLATLINIADELGYNLVPSKSVAGTITIRLTQVPLRQALTLMLNQVGLTYLIEDNIMRVATAGELQAEEDAGRLQTKIFPINYATASEIMSLVKTALSSRGKVEIDTRTNRLIVTDTPLKLEAVGEMIKKLDTPTPQVEIEAAVIAFRRGKSTELGIQWRMKDGSITGTTPTGTGQGGTDFDVASTPSASGSSFGSIAIGTIKTGLTVGAILRALESQDDAEILARPHVTVLNNKTANMNIATDFPYVSAFNQQTGVATYSTVSTGIVLNVTPQINDAGWIILKVKPSVSSVISAGPPPVVDKREAETEVLVKNGATLVIGGLLREDEVVTTNKVPILAEVPVIGGIFRNTSSQKVKNELTILITPKIITPN